MRILLLVLLLSVFVSSCKKEIQPNIIFLLTDDQRWDAIGCSGNTLIKTPNMDKLAGEGVYFPNTFVTSPICMISRATIFSGQYARRHGILDFKTYFSPEAFSQTYPILLKNNGYQIGFIGKYGLGSGENHSTGAWDYWRGFSGQGKYWHKDSLGNDIHLTRLMSRWAVEFIDEIDDEKPFCLSVSYKAPHVQDGDPRQFLYDTNYSNLFANTIFPAPATGDSANWYSYPGSFRENNTARIRWKLRFSTPEKFQESMRGYYRLIYGVDVAIGELRAKLREKGLEKRTIIILMGDNGFYLGEHGMAGKWYEHEESIRVPLVIYNPFEKSRSKIGSVIDKMVLNVDIAPTILDYAHVEIPKEMQGRSINKLIENPGLQWRNDYLFEHLFKYDGLPRSEGVVTDSIKYAHFLDRDTTYEWLFDLRSDPLEINNLSNDTAYQTVKFQFKKRLEILKKQNR